MKEGMNKLDTEIFFSVVTVPKTNSNVDLFVTKQIRQNL